MKKIYLKRFYLNLYLNGSSVFIIMGQLVKNYNEFLFHPAPGKLWFMDILSKSSLSQNILDQGMPGVYNESK
jgi:hypothetical protein